MLIRQNISSAFCRFINTSHHSLCSRQTSHSQIFDVVISGGGLVGCALACALGSSKILSGKKILLLESGKEADYTVDSVKYSNRVCAISPGTKSLFENFNAWEKMHNVRVKEVKKMNIWESCSDARLSFQYPDTANSVAYIIENNVMLGALNRCLADFNNLEVSRGRKAISYHLPVQRHDCTDLVLIKLDDGTEIRTKLLVGADGVNSSVRSTMGVKYVHWNYNQKGIVATLKLSEATENVVAWQRFLPSGPIALLPLTDDLCSLVWTVSLAMSKRLLKMTDEEFVDSLNTYLWSEKYKNPVADSAISTLKKAMFSILPEKESIKQLPPSILSVEAGSRAAFPLALGHATEYIAPRVALIGDAAHRVHPLAGQGVNLGFGDVGCLVDCLETSVRNGEEIGNFDALRKYETLRQRHIVPSMVAIDALNRLYGTEFTPIVILRSLGLSIVDSLDSLKGRIMKHAAS